MEMKKQSSLTSLLVDQHVVPLFLFILFLPTNDYHFQIGIPNNFIKFHCGAPIRHDVPKFPLPASFLTDLKNKYEKEEKTDYSTMWAGKYYSETFAKIRKYWKADGNKDIMYLETQDIINYYFH